MFNQKRLVRIELRQAEIQTQIDSLDRLAKQLELEMNAIFEYWGFVLDYKGPRVVVNKRRK